MKQKSLLQTKVPTKVGLTLGIGAIGLFAVILTFGPTLIKKDSNVVIPEETFQLSEIQKDGMDRCCVAGCDTCGYNITSGKCVGTCNKLYKQDKDGVWYERVWLYGNTYKWSRTGKPYGA